MTKHVPVFTGHLFAIDQGADTTKLPHASNYTTFYTATDVLGRKWVLAKGHPQAKKQIVVWYPNGKMWSGFGGTFIEALDGAIKDAWFAI